MKTYNPSMLENDTLKDLCDSTVSWWLFELPVLWIGTKWSSAKDAMDKFKAWLLLVISMLRSDW